MKELIEKIKANSIDEIEKAEDLKTLNELKVKYLGKISRPNNAAISPLPSWTGRTYVTSFRPEIISS